jgi:hypothetical protein
MEDLITNAHVLYDEHSTHHSPPLPPTPAGEPVPLYPYGSKSTKIATVPPAPLQNLGGPYPPSPPQDFTPRLPPRPANSIHPSLRANPQTPTRGRADAPPLLPLRHNMSPEQSPPSPSVSSTVYETDDENGFSEALEQPAATPTAQRPPSPQPTTAMTEGPGPDTRPHDVPTPTTSVV